MSKPSIVEMVCFMESLAESDTPWDITELSSGSIRFSMFAITENSQSSFRVETESFPPPLLRQRTVRFLAAEEESCWWWCWRTRPWRESRGGGATIADRGWWGLGDRSATREREKARAEAAGAAAAMRINMNYTITKP
ncbi:hypothetical protein Tsubulata_013638 [Turnera subulata]|uniref:Uncharacterized protein n=1 Tax=Turnera subulata TaxID=218843 RepID=A0A9Q0F9V7_9ROSI|nr:hypothetical protein Tsubulata_013638 [Turnera subulata]